MNPTTPEVTEWFSAEVKPVHVGYYHTLAEYFPRTESLYNWWWDGKSWLFDEGGKVCRYQDRVWRGLRSPA